MDEIVKLALSEVLKHYKETDDLEQAVEDIDNILHIPLGASENVVFCPAALRGVNKFLEPCNFVKNGEECLHTKREGFKDGSF